MTTIKDLKKFREQVRGRREREWIRDAVRLRKRKPEETLRTMFDLIKFAEKISRAKKCEP